MNNKAIKTYNKGIKKLMKKREKVQNLLTKNNMHYDFYVDSQGIIVLTIENGDWKHDHLAFQHIMREAGFISFGRHIHEDENDCGDDSFTATYLYR